MPDRKLIIISMIGAYICLQSALQYNVAFKNIHWLRNSYSMLIGHLHRFVFERFDFL